LCFCSVYPLFISLHQSFKYFLAKLLFTMGKSTHKKNKYIKKVKIKINKTQYKSLASVQDQNFEVCNCGETLNIQCSMRLGECPAIRSFMWRCLHIPKFVWPSFRQVPRYSEGLTEVSWSVYDWGSVLWFSLSCEDAYTSPNSFDRVFIECDSEGLTNVSWSVVRFGLWCEEASTTPNSSDMVHEILLLYHRHHNRERRISNIDENLKKAKCEWMKRSNFRRFFCAEDLGEDEVVCEKPWDEEDVCRRECRRLRHLEVSITQLKCIV